MNGFSEHGLDEDAFGEKGNLVSAFDAFRKFAIKCQWYRRIQLTRCVSSKSKTSICDQDIRWRKMDSRNALRLLPSHIQRIHTLVAGLRESHSRGRERSWTQYAN